MRFILLVLRPQSVVVDVDVEVVVVVVVVVVVHNRMVYRL